MNFLKNLFSEKKRAGSNWQEKTILCPLKGNVIPLSEVNDPVFAHGILGPGIGIEPEEGRLCSPVNGVVSAIYPTGHAIGLQSTDGMEILIHVGINTVEMKGNGFSNRVKQGQKVKAGDILSEIDISKIREAGYLTTTMILVTNADIMGELTVEAFGETEALAPVCRFQ